MAITATHFITAFLIFIMPFLHSTAGQIGVFYGRNGDNLPCPSAVVALYKKYNIQRMRIYEPDHPTLDALRGTNIELTMNVPNINDLAYVASSQDNANRWIQDNVRNYIPGVNFKHIVVGNEISPIRNREYVQYVLPAIQNIQAAISAAGLSQQIKVTTSVDTAVLGNASPPQDAVFQDAVVGYLTPIVQFLANSCAPLFVSIYPYFSYVYSSGKVNLQYALLQPNSGVVAGGVYYANLYYAIVDAMYAAMEKILAAAAEGAVSLDGNGGGRVVYPPEVKGGESGWPSKGGGGPNAADFEDARIYNTSLVGGVENVENARIYNNNLVQVVKKGTPKRPNQPIETYIFAMFDEDLKKPPGIEQNFGIFLPNGQPKYPVNFN